MAIDPREVAASIAKQRGQIEAARDQLREVFGNEAGWRRLASGSFSTALSEGVRAVVAPAPSGGFLCNVRVGSRIIASRLLDTPGEALEYVNKVKDELNAGT